MTQTIVGLVLPNKSCRGRKRNQLLQSQSLTVVLLVLFKLLHQNVVFFDLLVEHHADLTNLNKEEFPGDFQGIKMKINEQEDLQFNIIE